MNKIDQIIRDEIATEVRVWRIATTWLKETDVVFTVDTLSSLLYKIMESFNFMSHCDMVSHAYIYHSGKLFHSGPKQYRCDHCEQLRMKYIEDLLIIGRTLKKEYRS